MSEKALYEQKKQAQLDEWNAEIAKYTAKASGASADAQIEMHKQIKLLATKMEEGKTKLAEFAKASENGFESLKEGIETAWETTKSSFVDAAAHFKH